MTGNVSGSGNRPVEQFESTYVQQTQQQQATTQTRDSMAASQEMQTIRLYLEDPNNPNLTPPDENITDSPLNQSIDFGNEKTESSVYYREFYQRLAQSDLSLEDKQALFYYHTHPEEIENAPQNIREALSDIEQAVMASDEMSEFGLPEDWKPPSMKENLKKSVYESRKSALGDRLKEGSSFAQEHDLSPAELAQLRHSYYTGEKPQNASTKFDKALAALQNEVDAEVRSELGFPESSTLPEVDTGTYLQEIEANFFIGPKGISEKIKQNFEVADRGIALTAFFNPGALDLTDPNVKAVFDQMQTLKSEFMGEFQSTFGIPDGSSSIPNDATVYNRNIELQARSMMHERTTGLDPSIRTQVRSLIRNFPGIPSTRISPEAQAAFDRIKTDVLGTTTSPGEIHAKFGLAVGTDLAANFTGTGIPLDMQTALNALDQGIEQTDLLLQTVKLMPDGPDKVTMLDVLSQIGTALIALKELIYQIQAVESEIAKLLGEAELDAVNSKAKIFKFTKIKEEQIEEKKKEGKTFLTVLTTVMGDWVGDVIKVALCFCAPPPISLIALSIVALDMTARYGADDPGVQGMFEGMGLGGATAKGPDGKARGFIGAAFDAAGEAAYEDTYERKLGVDMDSDEYKEFEDELDAEGLGHLKEGLRNGDISQDQIAEIEAKLGDSDNPNVKGITGKLSNAVREAQHAKSAAKFAMSIACVAVAGPLLAVEMAMTAGFFYDFALAIGMDQEAAGWFQFAMEMVVLVAEIIVVTIATAGTGTAGVAAKAAASAARAAGKSAPRIAAAAARAFAKAAIKATAKAVWKGVTAPFRAIGRGMRGIYRAVLRALSKAGRQTDDVISATENFARRPPLRRMKARTNVRDETTEIGVKASRKDHDRIWKLMRQFYQASQVVEGVSQGTASVIEGITSLKYAKMYEELARLVEELGDLRAEIEELTQLINQLKKMRQNLVEGSISLSEQLVQITNQLGTMHSQRSDTATQVANSV